MKLNTISNIVLLLMLAFSFSFGFVSVSDSRDPLEIRKLNKTVDDTVSAYGKGKDLVTSLGAKKDNYNEEQLTLLKQAEELEIKLKKSYDKTLIMSSDSYINEENGYSSFISVYIYYDQSKIKKTERLSKNTVAIYEEIKAINDQILALSNETLPSTVSIIPVAAVPPQLTLIPEDEIVESLNDNIINDVVNVVPPVIVPEVVVPEVPSLRD